MSSHTPPIYHPPPSHAVRGYEALLGSRPWGIWDPLEAGFCNEEFQGGPPRARGEPHGGADCAVWVGGCHDPATEGHVMDLLQAARLRVVDVLRVGGQGPGVMLLFGHPGMVRGGGVSVGCLC